MSEVGLIPWDEIDPEIRPLVAALNDFGCRTEWSCAGHQDGHEAYVTFRADPTTALAFLDLISPMTIGGENRHLRYGVRHEVDAYDGGFRYTIRIVAPTLRSLRVLTERVSKSAAEKRPLGALVRLPDDAWILEALTGGSMVMAQKPPHAVPHAPRDATKSADRS